MLSRRHLAACQVGSTSGFQLGHSDAFLEVKVLVSIIDSGLFDHLVTRGGLRYMELGSMDLLIGIRVVGRCQCGLLVQSTSLRRVSRSVWQLMISPLVRLCQSNVSTPVLRWSLSCNFTLDGGVL